MPTRYVQFCTYTHVSAHTDRHSNSGSADSYGYPSSTNRHGNSGSTDRHSDSGSTDSYSVADRFAYGIGSGFFPGRYRGHLDPFRSRPW